MKIKKFRAYRPEIQVEFKKANFRPPLFLGKLAELCKIGKLPITDRNDRRSETIKENLYFDLAEV